MTRRRSSLIIPVLAVAVLLPGGARLEATQPPAESARQAIDLVVTSGEHQTRLATLEGVPARITTTEGEVLELVVTVESGPASDRGPNADLRVAVAAYELVPVGPSSRERQSNLLSTHLLEAGGSAIIFSGRVPLRAELVRVRPAAAPTDGMRPIDRCCVSCPEGPSVCACEVSTPCGSCSTGC